MRKGSFKSNFNTLEKANLGKIARELENLDYSDDCPELSESDYRIIDDIREIRNYWCHQCYLDYIYISNDSQRERAFQKVANRLHYDENRTYNLMLKTEKIKEIILDKYR